MPQNKKYTLLFIPHDGLFFSGGEFLDGHGNRITWDRSIPVYPSHSRAETARDRILERYPERYAGGQLVMLGVELKEIPEDEPAEEKPFVPYVLGKL